MRFKTDNFHEYKEEHIATLQVTLDDDFNVPDSKEDIDEIVREWGNVVIDDVKVNKDRGSGLDAEAKVMGRLDFSILYIARDSGEPVKMQGKMTFDENVNLSSDAALDYVTCKATLEDLNIRPINSRKVSLKAIVTLSIYTSCLMDKSFPVEIVDASESVECLHRDYGFVQLVVNQRDNFRIKQDISVPATKPEIAELIWEDVCIHNMNTRMGDDEVEISGDLCVFFMYKSVEGNRGVEWYETNMPFSGRLSVSGANPDLIPYVCYKMLSQSIEIRTDIDGANRDLQVDVVVALDIKAYEEKNETVVEDIYSPVREIGLNKYPREFKHLLVKNSSINRVAGKLTGNSVSDLLQICNCTANVAIDECRFTEDGLSVTGAVTANVFYVTDDDLKPLGSAKLVIPFENLVSISESHSDSLMHEIMPYVSSVAASINSAGEVEIKVSICMEVICFEVEQCELPDGEIEMGDKYDLSDIPAMVGFISEGNMRYWDVAKKYHTTMSSILSVNEGLGKDCTLSETVPRGTKMLLVR